MTRIQPVQPTQANEKTQKLLDGVQRGMGMVPNMFKTLAHSSAALSGYLSFSQALGGALTPTLREQIALAVAGIDCVVSRSGYTGEDGYEISVPADRAEDLARRLLDEPEVRLAASLVDPAGRPIKVGRNATNDNLCFIDL